MEKLHAEMVSPSLPMKVRCLLLYMSFPTLATKAYIWRNRGEIAEGWYDPSMREKALAFSASTNTKSLSTVQRLPSHERGDQAALVKVDDDLVSDDELGPSLPPQGEGSKAQFTQMGPAIPSLQDLELKRGKCNVKVLNGMESH